MKRIVFPLLLVMGLIAKGQTGQTDPKWIFQGDFLLQNAFIETTIGPDQVFRSTNIGSQIHIGRSISKGIFLNLSTSSEHNWVLNGHTFTGRTIGLGFSTNNNQPMSDNVTVSSVVGFSGYYKFLHGFKAPEGANLLKPDNGVFGLSMRLGFNINAGRIFFGPVLNAGLDFKEFKFTNGETLKFKEYAAIGFGFGFRF